MNIFEYYLELLEKPKYMLSTTEQAFVDFFPLVVILVVTGIVLIICGIVEIVKNRK